MFGPGDFQMWLPHLKAAFQFEFVLWFLLKTQFLLLMEAPEKNELLLTRNDEPLAGWTALPTELI